MTSEYQELAEQFIQWYYDRSNNSREELESVYTDDTLVTFQDIQIYGKNPRGQLSIMERLLSEGLQQMTKQVTNFTAQPSISGTVLICAQGSMKMTIDEAESLSFIENFLIGRDPSTDSFYIINQVFSTYGV